MFITVEELQEHPVRFDETFAPGQLEYAIEDLQPVAPLKVQGTASLLDQQIQVKGRLETELEWVCARCLEPVLQALKRDFDLYYQPLAQVPREDEVEVPRGEEELGFYQGDGLLLDDVAKEQVLLALPLRTLCREDCKGLCSLCGGNRNQVSCNCHTHTRDSRWDVLKEI